MHGSVGSLLLRIQQPMHTFFDVRTDQRYDFEHRSLLVQWNYMHGSVGSLLLRIQQPMLTCGHSRLCHDRWFSSERSSVHVQQ